MNQTEGRVEKNNWGDYQLFSLINKSGMQVDISDLGASIINWFICDRKEAKVNIVLGYDTPEEYLLGNVYFGCVVGPWANRIANGRYSVDGQNIQLEQNEGSNHLHGASAGLGKKRWSAEVTANNEILLSVIVSEGEAGYPADIDFSVRYTLTDENELEIEYSAIPKGTTPINMTQHTYFNLTGCEQNIFEHKVQIFADNFLEVDKAAIPEARASVENTPMDLRQPTLVAKDIDGSYEQLINAGGFDHCWCLSGNGMREAAVVSEGCSGICLEVLTDQPGIQFYSGNFLDNEPGRNGIIYHKRSGLCLETQCYPNQINMSNAIDCIYRAGEKYTHNVVYKTSVK